MFTLYLNNFRGFKKTFLPIKDVNFLVGENSTGKTSILKLLQVIQNFQFWETFDLNIGEIDLGYFYEITDKPYFEIGLKCTSNNLEENEFFLMRFQSENGVPVLSNYKYLGIDLMFSVQEYSNHFMIEFSLFPASVFEKNTSYSNDELTFFSHPLTYQFREKYFTPMKDYFFDYNYLHGRIREKVEEKKLEHGIIYPFLSFLKHESENIWIAPIRAEPKRTYDSYKIKFNPDGSHIPYILKRILLDEKNEGISKAIIEFGVNSGLFEKIEIKKLGNDEVSPFEIIVYLDGKPMKISNVGYGVSQILPVIVEVLAKKESTTFAIQQPEVHLHPKGQAAFGGFLYEIACAENKKFLIETHSDYLIDRFRLIQNKNQDNKKQISSQVIFFEREKDGNKLTCLPIGQVGSLPDEQPENFRDFFIKEQLELLTI